MAIENSSQAHTDKRVSNRYSIKTHLLPIITVTVIITSLFFSVFFLLAQSKLLEPVNYTVTFYIAGIVGAAVISAFSTHVLARKLTDPISSLANIADEIQQNETLFPTLIETIPAIVWLKDPDGVYLACNHRFEQLIDRKNSDIMGKNDYDFFPKDLAEFFRQKDRDAIANGKPTINEEEVTYASDGHHEMLETIKSPMYDTDGKLIGVLGMAHDVTKRKEIETELETHRDHLQALVDEQTHELKVAIEEAETANKAKSVFLSSMSHELRTPLNSILGFAQLLEMPDELVASDERKEYLHQIRSGGEHLLELINEVLDLAKIEAGKLSISLEVVDANLLISNCLTFAETLADKNKITIHNRTGEDLPSIWTDHLRAKQVILNLVSNAIKYNNEGGDVWIDAEQKDDIFHLSVTDNGFGIKEEDKEKMFQTFQRLSAENSKIEGTGIGLALTKRLVEEMGEKIGYTSTYEEGSTFWIDFPIIKLHPDDEDSSKLEQEEGQFLEKLSVGSKEQYLVLYVEDNPANLLLMESIIKLLPNITLISTDTAEQGLTLAEQQQPHVIIFDINLPGMSGIEAAKLAKSNEKLKHIPILALSADAMPSSVSKGKDAGLADYLTKPINITKLITALRKVLN